MIAIIDYDAGNLRSVEKALSYIGETPLITRDREALLLADKVILPGVGAFGDAMEKLDGYQLVPVISEIVKRETPFLGICLGMQVLFERSDEAPGVKGLSLLKGSIRRIPKAPGLKIPHMGWNSLEYAMPGRLFKDMEKPPYVYFVHSYYLEAEEACVTATASYGVTIHASVEKGNLFGCQFHPEKSGQAGLAMLKNFVLL